MPVVPQFTAGAPAGPSRPVLASEDVARPDISATIGALGNVARAAGVAVGMPTADPETGQASARGFQGFADSLNQLGNVVFEIRRREADARNAIEIERGQTAMEEEYGRFLQWREGEGKNQPERWESEWADRFGSFSGSYFDGKELAPVARDAIALQFETYGRRKAVDVGVGAVQQTTAQAREAYMANVRRAIEAKDSEAARDIAFAGWEEGYWGEDDAVRIAFQAEDQIEAETVESLNAMKETALLERDPERALSYVDQMPIPEEDKALQRAAIRERDAYSLLIEQAEDAISEDPEKALRELDGDGYKQLRASDRAKLADIAANNINAERSAVVNAIKDGITLGEIKSPSDLAGRPDFESLSARQKLEIEEFYKAGALNDVAEYATMRRALQAYDPARDPRGEERTNFETGIALRFEGKRAEELQNLLVERLENPEPLPPSQRVVSDIFSSIDDRFKNGELGNYRLTGSQIKRVEGDNGEVTYHRYDDGGYFRRATVGPAIKLSERDRQRFESGEKNDSDLYEDLQAKESAWSRSLEIQQEIERKISAGEITEAEEIEAEVNRLFGNELNSSLETRLQKDRIGNELPGAGYGTINAGLFPTNPETEIEELLNATGY